MLAVVTALAIATAPVDGWIKIRLALGGLFIAGVIGVTYDRDTAGDVRTLSNLMWMLVVVFAALGVSAFVARGNQAFIAKMIAVVILSILPGWLYFQFVKVRGRTLWDEYVLSLYRLKAATVEYLPPPPKHSRYYIPKLHDHVEDLETNLFRQKFESVYGEIVVPLESDASKNHVRARNGTGRVRGETFRPVLFATVLLVVAWSLVLQPDPYRSIELFPGAAASDPFGLPGAPLRFGFLGAYLFVLQMLMRRYFQNDLKAAAYISVVVRVISVALIVLALHQVLPADLVASRGALAFAFLIGMFPYIGIQAIRVFVSNRLRNLVPSLESRYPLSDLDGLDVWYEARLLEEGIEDMQNLSTANLIDLMLHTRVPLERLVDWVDQAHLYLRVEGPERKRGLRRKKQGDKSLSDRERLRRLGIRTATDLQDAFTSPRRREGMSATEYRDALEQHRLVMEKLPFALNGDDEQGWPSRLRVILRTLESEPNLHHVRSWKEIAWQTGSWAPRGKGV